MANVVYDVDDQVIDVTYGSLTPGFLQPSDLCCTALKPWPHKTLPQFHTMVDLTPASQSAPDVPPKMMSSLKVTDDSVLVVNQLLLP